MSKITMLLILILTTSCGGVSKTKLSESGRDVNVLKFRKTSGCSVLDKVVGKNENGSLELAKNHARNLAGDLGGTAIYFDEEIQNGNEWEIHATAFTCD